MRPTMRLYRRPKPPSAYPSGDADGAAADAADDDGDDDGGADVGVNWIAAVTWQATEMDVDAGAVDCVGVRGYDLYSQA